MCQGIKSFHGPLSHQIAVPPFGYHFLVVRQQLERAKGESQKIDPIPEIESVVRLYEEHKHD